MDRSRGSQGPAIGTDIEVPLSVVSEVAAGEHAIRRRISFAHGDMRGDALTQQPCKQFADSVGGIGCEPIGLEIKPLLGASSIVLLDATSS